LVISRITARAFSESSQNPGTAAAFSRLANLSLLASTSKPPPQLSYRNL
jgi:hypothetical protein